MHPALRKALSAALITVIFFFLIRDFVRNWQNIPFDKIHFSVIPIIVSYVLLFVTFLIFVTAWRSILKNLGEKLDFRNAFWIMCSSQMGKYMPGKIWFFLGRIYMARQVKLKGLNVALSILIETILTIIWGVVLALISILVSKNRAHFPLWILFLLIIVGVVILHPSILNRSINFSLRILKKDKITIPLSYPHLLLLSLYFWGLWIAQLIGFYFVINSFYEITLTYLPFIIFVYTTSWIAGFLAPFAPGGLGVREGIMSLSLSSIMPTGLAIGVSFISRIWITSFEIIVFLIGLLIRPRHKKI